MRVYFTAVFIAIILLDLVIYRYDGSMAIIIITGIIGVLNLLAALFYNMIVEVYNEVYDFENKENE
jgi:succinate-acetate transporter protein